MSTQQTPPQAGALDYTHTDVVKLPQPDSEQRYAIRRLDWERLKRCVAACKTTQSLSYADLYHTLFGVAATCAVAWLPLLSAQGIAGWIVTAFAIGAIAAFIMACALVSMDRRLKKANTDRIADIEADMAGIESGFTQP